MHDETGGRDEPMTDAAWSRVEAELRREPRVDPAAIERAMSVVRMTRMERSGSPGRGGALGWLTRPRTIAFTPLHALAATLVVAAGVALLFGARRPGEPGVGASREVATSGETASADPRLVRNAASGAQRSVQFVIVAGDAHRVSLVGDFNDWDVAATPLQRVSEQGLWSVVVPLTPGRHVYSFVVDGTQWVPDSAAPRAPEDEFGGANSIVFVGQDS